MHTYTIVKFTNRQERLVYPNFQAAAARFRKLENPADYFIQGPWKAWFADDFKKKEGR
jgi:hypothetical protein